LTFEGQWVKTLIRRVTLFKILRSPSSHAYLPHTALNVAIKRDVIRDYCTIAMLPFYTLQKHHLSSTYIFFPSAIAMCRLNTINYATVAPITPCKFRVWRVCHVHIIVYKQYRSMMGHNYTILITRITEVDGKLGVRAPFNQHDAINPHS
jgi:hypothetical protein